MKQEDARPPSHDENRTEDLLMAEDGIKKCVLSRSREGLARLEPTDDPFHLRSVHLTPHSVKTVCVARPGRSLARFG